MSWLKKKCYFIVKFKISSIISQIFVVAEALFKAGIAALLEAPQTMNVEGKPKSSEPFLIQFIHNFLSNLVIVPVSVVPPNECM